MPSSARRSSNKIKKLSNLAKLRKRDSKGRFVKMSNSSKRKSSRKSYSCKNKNCKSKNTIYTTKKARHHDESDMKFIQCKECDYKYVL